MRWGFKLSRTTGTTEQMIDERVRSAVAADAGSIEVPADEPGPAGADGGGAPAMVALIVGIVGVVAAAAPSSPDARAANSRQGPTEATPGPPNRAPPPIG